jgi:hypothetical protein
MHATQQQPAGPYLFKPSLLAWRANYLAGKSQGDGTKTDTPAVRCRVLKARTRKPTARR